MKIIFYIFKLYVIDVSFADSEKVDKTSNLALFFYFLKWWNKTHNNVILLIWSSWRYFLSLQGPHRRIKIQMHDKMWFRYKMHPRKLSVDDQKMFLEELKSWVLFRTRTPPACWCDCSPHEKNWKYQFKQTHIAKWRQICFFDIIIQKYYFLTYCLDCDQKWQSLKVSNK